MRLLKSGLAAIGAAAAIMASAGIAAAAPAAPQASAESSATVAPRVNCGGFNGHIGGIGSPSISVWGQLWETCGGRNYLYVSYDEWGTHYNENIANVSGGNAGVNWQAGDNRFPTIGHIKITVCSTYGGWHCGAPVSV